MKSSTDTRASSIIIYWSTIITFSITIVIITTIIITIIIIFIWMTINPNIRWSIISF